MSWGGTTSLNCGQKRAYFSPQGDIWERRTMVERYLQSKIPDSSTTALWQSYQQSSSSKSGGTGEGNYELGYTKYLHSYFRQILQRGTNGFLPLRRKARRGFLSSVNIHRPRSCLNLLTLGTMASTLTITPPRRVHLTPTTCFGQFVYAHSSVKA
jgi:hypothetical protein